MDLSKEFKMEWITDGINEMTIEFANKFGRHLCDISEKGVGNSAMTTSQIRNVFGEVKRIQAKGYESEKAAFLLLRPKLAYAEARVTAKNSKSKVRDFRQIIDMAHIAVQNNDNFQNFVDFFEATLAYHKFHGGKDN